MLQTRHSANCGDRTGPAAKGPGLLVAISCARPTRISPLQTSIPPGVLVPPASTRSFFAVIGVPGSSLSAISRHSGRPRDIRRPFDRPTVICGRGRGRRSAAGCTHRSLGGRCTGFCGVMDRIHFEHTAIRTLQRDPIIIYIDDLRAVRKLIVKPGERLGARGIVKHRAGKRFAPYRTDKTVGGRGSERSRFNGCRARWCRTRRCGTCRRRSCLRPFVHAKLSVSRTGERTGNDREKRAQERLI